MIMLSASLVSGCALDSERIGAAGPELAARYRAAPERSAKAISQDWLAAFRSNELAQFGSMTLEGNLDLDAALARLSQAEAQMMIAGAALYPQINGGQSASRSRSPGTLGSSTGPFSPNYNSNFNVGLSASYVVDFWGRNASLAEAGRIGAVASRFDYDTLVVTTLATLANAYFQILVAQDRLLYARDNIRAAEHVLGAIRARVDVGTATALDVAQQESVLANLRVNIPVLERQAQQQKNIVALLLGRTPESVNVKGGRLNALALPQVKPGLPSQLLLRRPDIAAAEARLLAGEANIVAARAAFLPSITLTGNANLASLALKNLLRADALALSVADSLAQPIFDGYNLQGQLDNRRGQRNEMLANYRKSIVSALTDVENALIGVRKYAEQERLQAMAVTAARRAYDISQQRLNEGVIDIVVLLTTQTNLFSAQDALTLVRYQRLLAVVSLYQALGGGFTREYSDPMLAADPAMTASPRFIDQAATVTP
ncbi:MULTISPECIES: efflux transporter outer membrane subunit [unclassified Beijerinckia]|uniref:efflux transporter outer membrane subunit n=1 Tax=unclassified Beijerinckia TaxID=2638183 RepID=UPI00089BD02C|nr:MULTISPECIES: efflux transporter outer membrane subunit [unclassified Beijerinckia]MDH7794176.1 multidrug efflux system outer membrane protein [Beijerinckia sp. GAS462]SEB55012.1 efflux transporter, outer membrane factor (OMF) lipoprotein, NodT family [Beijerinckia sp. 28-YEA-48]